MLCDFKVLLLNSLIMAGLNWCTVHELILLARKVRSENKRKQNLSKSDQITGKKVSKYHKICVEYGGRDGRRIKRCRTH